MRTGVQKNNYHKKDFSFERTFGSVSLATLPEEYNADLGLSFPDQNKDGLPNGCTGYTVSEIGQDENGELFDPKFTYENTLSIANLPPNSPCKVRDALKESRTFGLKRKKEGTTLVRGAYYDVDKVGDYFDGIRSSLHANRVASRTVLAASPWFSEWIFPGTGVLKAPKKYVWDSGTIGHCYKICGWKTIQNVPYLILKPWCGPKWGDNGYAYMSREICNKTFAISGTALYVQSNLTPGEVSSVKWDIQELILAFCRRLVEVLSVKPAPTMPPEAPVVPVAKSNREKLYDTAKACIGRNMRSGAAPVKFGCVDAFRGVYKEAFGVDIAPGVLDTNGLNAVLSKSKDFKAVLEKELQSGDVQIALTVGDVHGHVLVRGKQDSMSNDSSTGLWKANYHNANVQIVFRDTLHLQMRYYRPVDSAT